jgi:transcriptional regulator with XRE-family HTH domain/tetratricopeptide (TPR) repeat protein
VNGEAFGATLKRSRETRRLSVRALAARTHYGKSQISDLENSIRKPRPDVAARLEEVLQAHGELVAAAERDQPTRPSQVTTGTSLEPRFNAGLATRLSMVGREEWEDSMYRRTFVLGLGGLAGLGIAAPGLALEAARHGLTAGLAEQRGETAVEEWHEIVREYGYSYQVTAPAELLESLIVDVLGVQYAMDRQRDDAALRELYRVSALLAALTAMTVSNVGLTGNATRWWRTARHLADRSGTTETAAWVRGHEVVRGLYERRPLGTILQLVDEAERLADAAPATALPELIAGKAQALALAGRPDEATATLRRLHDAYAALPDEVPDDRDTIFVWAEDRLRYTEGFVYSQLGDVARADVAQRRAVEVYPASDRRGPAQIELQRALGLTRAGDTFEGVRLAQGTMSGLPPADHIRPVLDLSSRVLDAVPPEHQGSAAVAEFRDHLAALGFTAG